MIEVCGVSKSFGSVEVLRGVDLTVNPGEVLCIVGPSGAGKTTLLQIMGTLDTADSGTVRLLGQNIVGLSEKQLAQFRNRHIGFVFQFHQLLPEFTAEENVMIPALLSGADRAAASADARALLERLGLGARANHKPSELSGGERQRVAVARALINKPEIIFADEPSGSLDSDGKNELHRILFSLRDEMGVTLVIVTHDETLAAAADRMVRMHDGKF
ncbi:MAG: ABC transporter ATP-binding protein [Paludibacteraceae bacterium]|nr:ABC transporter ATP-binding protein [Paludibacteraceae bacterium]